MRPVEDGRARSSNQSGVYSAPRRIDPAEEEAREIISSSFSTTTLGTFAGGTRIGERKRDIRMGFMLLNVRRKMVAAH